MPLLTDEETCEKIGWKIDYGLYSNEKGWYVNGACISTPKFNTSLDAQQEYLWPWLDENGWGVNMHYSEGEACVVLNHIENPNYRADHLSPPFAFMMAFTKYVNSLGE